MEELDALALTHLGELKLCSLETAVASLGKAAGWHGNQLGNAKAANFTLRGTQDIDETQSRAQWPLRHCVRLVRVATMSNIMYIVLKKHTNIRISEHNINKSKSK